MAEIKEELKQQIAGDLLLQLVNFAMIDSVRMTDAIKFASQTGDDPYLIVKNDSQFSETRLVEALADKYGLKYDFDFTLPKLDSKFPLNYCAQNGLLPIMVDGADLALGLSSPTSLNAIRNLNLLHGKKLTAFFIPYSKLLTGIKNIDNPQYIEGPRNTPKVEDSPVIAVTEEAIPVASSSHGDKDAPVSQPLPDVKSKPNVIKESAKNPTKNFGKQVQAMLSSDVVSGLNEILVFAVTEKVSDIHLEVFRDKARLRLRKNGKLIIPAQFQGFVEKNYNAIISRLKILSDLDIAEKRLPQDGAANFASPKNNIDVDLRVSIIPMATGERAVLRILNKASLSVDIESLGFSEQQLSVFMRAIDSPQGLVLVTGPTGSGKSTTLYGAINHLNQDDVNILTAEDPIEYTLSGVGQVQMKDEIGLTFAAALRSFLRQDPEIILVGEIRDGETADIATKAALTGHLVLSTLHTNSSIGAITRLVNMGLPKYLVSNALSCIVAQRLIRTNCPMCKTSRNFDKNDPLLKRSIFKHLLDRQEFFGAGCDHCNMTGFSSRRAVHEVLEVDIELKNMINRDTSEIDMVKYARENGFSTMLERGLDFVHSGDTTLEELLRIVPMEAL
jgi:type IV pilus assembly protein PilB